MDTVKIENVCFLKDYRLDIMLSNGHRIIYNLKPRLVTARFSEIKEYDMFRKGELINGRFIQWNNSVELSLEEIMLAMKHIKI